MEVKKGYKQTEVGVIPTDWEVKKLGEISNVKTGPFGSALHERDYVENGTPIITVEHLGEQGVVHTNLPMVSDSDKKRLAAYSMQPDDIVFSRVGSVDRNSLIRNKENGWLFSGRLLRIRINEKNLYPSFLSYYFHFEPTKQRIRTVAVGQTMASLNTQILKDVQVAFPPTKAEQAAIAAALSDADALIQSLEKLIAKKRNIKQGAMQELLKPKDGWVVKKIKNIAPLQRGFDLPTTQLNPGKYPVVYSNGIDNFHSEYKVKGPGVVTGRSGTLGRVTYVIENYWPHNTSLWVTDFKGNYPLFVFYLYTHLKLERFGTGSGVPTLNRNDVHDFEIAIPRPVDQTRIATILSDMDAEISALESKLAKFKQVKQGMMQELLTGRIRLVKGKTQ